MSNKLLKDWIIEKLIDTDFSPSAVRDYYDEAVKETGTTCTPESLHRYARRLKNDMRDGVDESETSPVPNKVDPSEGYSFYDRESLIEILEEEIESKGSKISSSDLKKIASDKEIPYGAFLYFIPDLADILKSIYTNHLFHVKDDVEKEGYKERLSLLKKENNFLKKDEARFQLFMDSVERVVQEYEPFEAPPLNLEKKGNKRIVHMLLSDTHLGETVTELQGINFYNMEIAKKRIASFFEKTITYCSLVGADSVQINILGDIVSGNIHEELIATNELNVVEAVFEGSHFISSLIHQMSKYIKIEKIIAMAGNHARWDKKTPVKSHNTLSHERYMYEFIKRELIEIVPNFIIPDSIYYVDRTYDTNILFCHGDFFRGGTSNLSNISTTWARDSVKLNQLYRSINKEFNILCMGHVHSDNILNTFDGVKIITNSSVIGPNEYSVGSLKVGNPPSQTVFTIGENEGKSPHFLETIYL